jgi:glycine cleavage system aminomethyltransferase T
LSVHASSSPQRAPTELELIVRRAGGVLASREGSPVVVNYGSAAGELAACVSAVGIADSSELVKLELAGRAEALGAVVRDATGDAVAPGGALLAGEARWCAAGSERIIVLCEPGSADRLRDRLEACLAARPTVWLSDRSSEWCAISVVGRRTVEVLGALGVYGPSGDPRQTPPFAAGTAGLARALWLLESDRRALALVSRGQAGVAWQAIERAGRTCGIRYVGQDAVARYALLDRRPVGAAPA